MAVIYKNNENGQVQRCESIDDLMDKAFYDIEVILLVGINMRGVSIEHCQDRIREIIDAHSANTMIAEADMVEANGYYKGKIRIFRTMDGYNKWIADYEAREKER